MDLEQRVTRLEDDMTLLREEWSVVQQAPLIQGRLLNALRETQLEHSRTLEQHSRTLEQHSRTLEEHGRQLERLGRGQEQIVGMLTTLIEREPPV